MILTGYIAKWKSYPKDETKIRVARPHILSPSKELLHDYKTGKANWEEYTKRFYEEILNREGAVAFLRELKERSETENVRLMCYEKSYPCHRFLLADMIDDL